MGDFICNRCGNSDEKWIGYIRGKPYCRYCIKFKGELAKPHEISNANPILDVSYFLTKEQQRVSDKVLENYQNGINTLIHAVCGAGKTELVFDVILYALKNKQSVAFAIPRKDVVIELKDRLADAFSRNTVIAVYGQHSDILEADIVVLTTHQLYRYENYFDLIVMDEIDAFPFKNNKLLNTFFQKALRGHFVMMSATPDKATIDYFKHKGRDLVELNTRFHGQEIPVPKVITGFNPYKFNKLIATLSRFLKNEKPVLVFVPTINEAEKLHQLLNKFIPRGECVHSEKKNRAEIINLFKRRRYSYLVTTAVLERGITIKNLQVIIYNADSKIYDEYSLVQIAGRVGRKYDAPDGEVIFIGETKTNAMDRAIKSIERSNMFLQDLRRQNNEQ